MVDLSGWREHVVVAYLDEPPYFVPTEGPVPTGCDVELALSVLADLGVQSFEFVLTTFDQLIPGLLGRRWHVNVPMFVTPRRGRDVTFSRPVWSAHDGFVVRTDEVRDVSSYAAVAVDPTIRLAVVSGQVQHDAAVHAGVPAERIVVYADQDDACRGVLAGEADAAASTAPGNRAYVDRLGDPRLRAVRLATPDEALPPLGAFSFHPDATELIATFDAALGRHLGSAVHLATMRRYGFSDADLAPVLGGPGL